MKVNALIFDFNGLIVDDEPIHYECFHQVLRAEDIELTEEEYWNLYLGYDDKGLFEALYKKEAKKLTSKKIRELVLQKNSLYLPLMEKKLCFFPGVIDFIQKTREKYHLAIVSGALRSEIDFVLKKGNILDAFSVIVSADNTKHGKPDPEGFVIALAQLKKKNPKIRPETCLVLEDSHAGIEATHRAQMKVCALTHTYSEKHLREADFVVSSFEEVLKTIQAIIDDSRGNA